MKRILVFFALSIINSESYSKDILLECGTATRNGFNGWNINPFDVFENVVFTDETIDFYSDNGGDYTISLIRKIESMKDYPLMDLTVQVNAVNNCTINYIDVFVSEDGKSWTAVKFDRSNFKAEIQNSDLTYQFLKIAVNASFENDGYLQCAYVKLEGENEWEMEAVIEESQVIENPFFIFCFNKMINIETKSEETYDVIFSNIAGQIVYTESTTGSTRIETDLPEGVYVISIIQNGEILQSKKVVF